MTPQQRVEVLTMSATAGHDWLQASLQEDEEEYAYAYKDDKDEISSGEVEEEAEDQKRQQVDFGDSIGATPA